MSLFNNWQKPPLLVEAELFPQRLVEESMLLKSGTEKQTLLSKAYYDEHLSRAIFLGKKCFCIS